jgi:hypothetical protein
VGSYGIRIGSDLLGPPTSRSRPTCANERWLGATVLDLSQFVLPRVLPPQMGRFGVLWRRCWSEILQNLSPPPLDRIREPHRVTSGIGLGAALERTLDYPSPAIS